MRLIIKKQLRITTVITQVWLLLHLYYMIYVVLKILSVLHSCACMWRRHTLFDSLHKSAWSLFFAYPLNNKTLVITGSILCSISFRAFWLFTENKICCCCCFLCVLLFLLKAFWLVVYCVFFSFGTSCLE